MQNYAAFRREFRSYWRFEIFSLSRALLTGSCYTDVRSSVQSLSASTFPWWARDCCRTAWWRVGCRKVEGARRSAPWRSRCRRSSWPAETTTRCRWPSSWSAPHRTETATAVRRPSTTALCGCRRRPPRRRTRARKVRPDTSIRLQWQARRVRITSADETALRYVLLMLIIVKKLSSLQCLLRTTSAISLV